MRKWRCTKITLFSGKFTVGKIYESDDRGFGIFDDEGFAYKDLSPCNNAQYSNMFRHTKFEEIKENNMKKMKEFTKSDLQEFDEVVFRDSGKNIYYQGNFRGGCPRDIYYYNRNLTRDDEHNESDIMKVIRNKEVIWERVEKSPIQIELESLEQQQREIADKLAELRKKV